MSNCPLCGTQSLSDSQFCHKCGYNYSGETGKLDPDIVLENRYVIVKTLGKGGMGAVYQALDLRLNNIPVAIKEMSTRAVGTGNLQGAIAAFKKEAAMLISLRHPALPRINDFFSRGEDRWYLVMDYIEGETLAETVKRRGRIPQEIVLDWAIQLCEILNYLHGQKPPVIFRDLKPSNIMVTPKGQIKLIDFGIARHFKTGSSVDTSAYGSTGYAPPEQYGENQTDARSDIYALGAVLHFLLTGKDPSKNPFTFEPPGEILHAPVSTALETAIMKALSLKPGDRPGSAKEMLELLKEDGSDIAGRTETIPITASVKEKEPEEARADEKENEQVFTETLKVQQNTKTIGILGLGKPETVEIDPEATVSIDTPDEVAAGSVQKALLQKDSKDNLSQYTVQPQKVSKTGSTGWIFAAVGIVVMVILGQQWFNHLKSNGEGLGDKSYQTSGLTTGDSAINTEKSPVENPLQQELEPNGVIDINSLFNGVRSGDTNLVKKCLASGLSPNVKDSTGNTPLMEAAILGHIDIIEALLGAEADVNCASDKGGYTALIFAAGHNHDEIVNMLLKAGADPNMRESDRDTGYTALLYAIRNGNLQMVKSLLVAGADPYTEGRYMDALTLAMEASWNENGDYSSVLRCLVDSGLDPNKAAAHEYMNYKSEMLEQIINCGADPNKFMLGAISSDDPNNVRILLNHGADPNLTLPMYNNETILSYSKYNAEIYNILKAAGARE